MLKISRYLSGAAMAALFTFAPLASADAPTNLKQWAQEAGEAVDSVMRYPKIAGRTSGNASAVFHVTINQNGDVLNSKKVAGRGPSVLQGAAKRVVHSASFPALPEGEELTFELRLYYGLAAPSERNKKHKGRVTSEQIASNDASVVASLRVLSAD